MTLTNRFVTTILASLFATTLALAQAPAAQPQPQANPAAEPQPAQPPAAQPQPAAAHDISLTIYSSADPASFDPQEFISQQRQGYNPQYVHQVPGFGVIRDTRTLNLKQGENHIDFTDVAQFIDPTTVSLTDLSVPANAPPDAAARRGIKVVEQQFKFDLVSPDKLLDKYIDHQITANVKLGNGKTEAVTGTLLSNNLGRLVLKTPQGLRMISDTSDVQLGKLPDGLITRPTLSWQLWAPAAGKRQVRTAYQTDGITWRADYNLVLNADDSHANLGAWVTIMNLSGATYKDASLKLIAGDVRRVKPQQPVMYMARLRERTAAAQAPAGFQEKSFFEYHLYTLPRKTTIDQNSTQQIALFPTIHGVKVDKVLVYYGLPQSSQWMGSNPQSDRDLGNKSNKKVDVYIQFGNKKANKLGIPLPAGKVRVYKADEPANPQAAGNANSHGTLEFVGEDLIDHTPKDAKVLIKIGQAFDITGERTQTDFHVDNRAHVMTESIKIVLHNHKNTAQKVIVKENLYRWINWEITKKSDDFEKVDSRTIHFNVDVPANGDKTVTYTVKYTW